MFASVLSIMGFSCALLGLSSQYLLCKGLYLPWEYRVGREMEWKSCGIQVVFTLRSTVIHRKRHFSKTCEIVSLPPLLLCPSVHMPTVHQKSDIQGIWMKHTHTLKYHLLAASRWGNGIWHQLLTSYPSTYLPDPSFHSALHLNTPCKQWGWNAHLQNV